MNKIKLNHKCDYCNEEIFIGEGTVIDKKLLHFKCFQEMVEEDVLWVGDRIFTKDYGKDSVTTEEYDYAWNKWEKLKKSIKSKSKVGKKK